MWKVLALATTFAGNLTIVASVANLIVVESAWEHLPVHFLGLRSLWIPDYDQDDFCWHCPAARVALRNCRYFL
jgi:hypothetical protein